MDSGKAPPGTAVDESRKLLRQMSHQSSEGNESVVSEELELLTNVYLDELDISYSERGDVVLKYHLTPSTADDKDKQFVYLDLTITLSVMYPNLKPEILFGESRGLSDAHLRGIAEGLYHKSLEYLGSPMIYELVEYAKDCLTDNNRPCGQCAICQFDFEETDDFTKTECYHYFHLPCLARYVEFFECQQREGEMEECRADLMLRKKPKQLECPVCREPISTGTTCLDAIQGVVSSSATDNSEVFRPSEELRSWQAHMASLLRQQREKGGVIDPSREDDTIDETWVHPEGVAELVSSARRKKIGEDSEVEEQPSHQLHEQEKRVTAVQHVSNGDALSQIHHVDIQSLDCGSECPPPDGGVPSESNLDICRGSENTVGTQHVREKHTDSRSCSHSITSKSGSESRPQNDNPDSKPLMGRLHSRPSHDRSRSRQYDDSHSRPHDGSHSRPHNGSHSRSHDESHSRPHDRSHSRQYDDSHSRPHDRSHSRQYDDSHSRSHDGSHSRPHASHFKSYKGPHSRPEHRSRDPRRDYRNSQQSAGRQTGGSDLPSGSRGDHRRRDRRRYDHNQDENYHRNQPTKDYHHHRHRDTKPKSIGAGQMVNAGVKEEDTLFEGRTVTRSEQSSRVEPSTEQTSSKEHGSQRHPVSGRNEHRSSSHETRESGYSKNHWSRGRAEKRGRYQDCISPCTTEK